MAQGRSLLRCSDSVSFRRDFHRADDTIRMHLDDPAADIVYLGALQCNNATLLAYSPLQIVVATG